MSVYFKEIPSGYRSITPYKLYKTWQFTQDNFTNVNASGDIGVYNAIYDAGDSTLLQEFAPNYIMITDMQGYPINVNYMLRNGTYYSPYVESQAPHNFPNGDVIRYAGGELRTVDGLGYGAPSGSYEIIGHVGRNIWYSIYHLFYRKGRNYQGVDYPMAAYYDEFDGSTSLYTSSAAVFSIPRAKYGESILKESFGLLLGGAPTISAPYSSSGNLSANIELYDDGKGNLYDKQNTITSFGTSVGNISYDKGLVIITDGEYYRYLSSSLFISANTSSLDADFSYSSYVTANQHTYICEVKSWEFNKSSNPSAYEPSLETTSQYGRYIFDDAVDANGNPVNFRPLASAIGLYDNENTLVAVAKFANPVRIENDIDSIFVVRFDM